MVRVEQWAEIRRLYFVKRLSIKEIARRTGRDRNTVRKALRSERPPRYSRPARPSKLDPFREEIHRLLRRRAASARQADPRAARRARLRGRQDDPGRLSARGAAVVSAAAAHLPAHLVSAGGALPVRPLGAVAGDPGRAAVRRGAATSSWAVCPTRAPAPARSCSRRRRPTCLYGIGRCLERLGALPETLVWDREGALHAGGGRPTEPFAAFLRPARRRLALPRAAGSAVEGRGRAAAGLPGDELRARPRVRQRARLPGAARPLVRRARQRPLPPHAALPARRPAGRGARVMRPLPERLPDVDRRLVTRVRTRPVRARRQQRLLARSATGRPPRRAAGLPARDPRRLPGHGRARLPARPLVRPPPHDHRARARESAPGAARRPGRARGRAAAARPLRRADPGMTTAPSSPTSSAR